MGIVGVSIVKSVSFRGVAQEFSNTYYYETPLSVSSAAASALIDAVVAIERPMHSGNVLFVRGLCWSAGGTKAENQMLSKKTLSFPGQGGGGASYLDKERAFLVRLRAGNDSRGNPVYLRKWWHLDLKIVSTTDVTDAAIQNTGQLPAAVRTYLEGRADALKNVTAGAQGFELVSEKGREIDGPTVAHPYLEHHQLGDAWRG